jgi:hypothetical protein
MAWGLLPFQWEDLGQRERHMGQSSERVSRLDQIPGDCYNLARTAIRRSGGCLTVGLMGLSDNLILLTPSHWRCWNRQLDEDLLSWSGFRNNDRQGLLDPVVCTLTVHHSYSRTIIHRLYDSLTETLVRELTQFQQQPQGQLIHLTDDRPTPPKRLY